MRSTSTTNDYCRCVNVENSWGKKLFKSTHTL